MKGVTTNAHPEPTAATVKGLYAHAFRCAKPDCSRPLYKQDNETGERTLNSRVAHIHARRPGGPRWIDMPSEENRADANLVLLCIEHSYEVDDLPDHYPAELLRLWKQAQLDEYEQARRGWPLTDTEAGRVLEASAQASEYHYAGAVLDAVRAVERFALASSRARVEPAAAAAAWRAARARARGSFTAWDQDGNPVYADPPGRRPSSTRLRFVPPSRRPWRLLTRSPTRRRSNSWPSGPTDPLLNRGPPGRRAP